MCSREDLDGGWSDHLLDEPRLIDADLVGR